MQIVGITVSYQYEDYLKHCLPNADKLDSWTIVVDPKDQPTLDLLEQYLPRGRIRLVLYDVTNGGACAFDKAGAIRAAQRVVHAQQPNAWVLLIDSDTILPANFRSIVSTARLRPDVLYGAHRVLCYTAEEIPGSLGQESRSQAHTAFIEGYFQLYFDKTKFYVEHSHDASMCDVAFSNLFTSRERLDLVTTHLGFCGVNWSGRRSARF